MPTLCVSSALDSPKRDRIRSRRLPTLRPSKSRTSVVKWLRSSRRFGSADLKETVNKLIPDSIGKDIEKACHSIYPLYDVFINKVKVLKRPRFDLGKLLDMHGEGKGAVAMETAEGEVVSRPEGYEPPVLDSV